MQTPPLPLIYLPVMLLLARGMFIHSRGHFSHTTPTHVTIIGHTGQRTFSTILGTPRYPCVVFHSITPVALVISPQAALRCAKQKASWSRNVYLFPWPK